jgi:hypothetical protein
MLQRSNEFRIHRPPAPIAFRCRSIAQATCHNSQICPIGQENCGAHYHGMFSHPCCIAKMPDQIRPRDISIVSAMARTVVVNELEA